jgi:hypothetical protein
LTEETVRQISALILSEIQRRTYSCIRGNVNVPAACCTSPIVPAEMISRMRAVLSEIARDARLSAL